MERYALGELDLWELADVYEWEFDSAVPEPFPSSKFCKNMRDLYYQQGLEYLKTFKGYDGKEILGVEQKFDIGIDNWIFNGVIDLIYKDENGKLIIRDYKSKSSFKSKKEKAEYARQLYLYALYVREKYGKFPDQLEFSMFRKNKIEAVPFNLDDLEEAISWAKDTVQAIRGCWDFEPNCEEFFSENLCNHRNYCDCRITKK